VVVRLVTTRVNFPVVLSNEKSRSASAIVPSSRRPGLLKPAPALEREPAPPIWMWLGVTFWFAHWLVVGLHRRCAQASHTPPAAAATIRSVARAKRVRFMVLSTPSDR